MADPIERLAHAFSKLPGIGQKSAQRLAFHVVRSSSDAARELADAVLAVKQATQWCTQCGLPSPTACCRLCQDPRRDAELLCIVEEPADLHAIEKTGSFRGRYHVLHGVLSPLDGIGPDDLHIAPLLLRLQSMPTREIIFALNPTVEGEATITYLSQLLRPFGAPLTRLASGIPLGAEVEYIDAPTLTVALEARRTL